MTEKNVHKLNVKSVAPFLRSIPVIALKPTSSVHIVAVPFTYGKNVKMSQSINATTIIALYTLKTNLNLISAKNSYPKLNLPSLNSDINTEITISLTKILPILLLKRVTLSSLSVTPLTPFALPLPFTSPWVCPPEKLPLL